MVFLVCPLPVGNLCRKRKQDMFPVQQRRSISRSNVVDALNRQNGIARNWKRPPQWQAVFRLSSFAMPTCQKLLVKSSDKPLYASHCVQRNPKFWEPDNCLWQSESWTNGHNRVDLFFFFNVTTGRPADLKTVLRLLHVTSPLALLSSLLSAILVHP